MAEVAGMPAVSVPRPPPKEECIRTHVLFCWPALLLACVTENACGTT
jgi:hypothetical protein